ncbi:GPW/gp25 family protein [Halomonas sp. BM-2019]|uniref:GPW/gp25 family protein n=1 Tax=Halomonas sp. BM-2019 TaxID=2811227 RepID=UPI001B3C2780|nr:MAG: GPW/gp25 family protein [Halomonas sp. BM-2019]
MIHIDYPFDFDERGRTALTSEDNHIRDMIEQFLFTRAGERVNRPDFGGGLLDVVFEPNSDALGSSLQRTAQAGLQQYLGDLITVQVLVASTEEAVLRVDVRYLVKRSGETRTESFERSLS